MKFLLDENLSPRIAEILTEVGHDAVHMRDIALRSSPDEQVLEAAREAGRVIISVDTDFGDLLAASNAADPSVLLRQGQRRAQEIAALIVVDLDAVAEDLESGAVVVADDDRIRIRSLPFRPT